MNAPQFYDDNLDEVIEAIQVAIHKSRMVCLVTQPVAKKILNELYEQGYVITDRALVSASQDLADIVDWQKGGIV